MLSQESQASIAATRVNAPNGDQRLEIVDALRGFALLGVVVANVAVSSGLNPSANPVLIAPGLAGTTFQWIQVQFIAGKFMAQFGILFGLGFGLMLERAARRRTPFVPRYLRRTGALFLFGVVSYLIGGGDVLKSYAVMGLILLSLRNASNRTLTLVAVACLFADGLLQVPREFLGHYLPSGRGRWPLELPMRQSGAYLELLAFRVKHLWAATWGSFLPSSAGACFVIGFLATRLQLLHDVERRNGFYARLLAISVVVFAIFKTLNPWLASAMGIWRPGVVVLAQAIAYMSAFVLLWNRGGKVRSALAALSPVGRMALTCYLAVWLIGVLLFEMTGAFNRVNAFVGTAIGVVVYAAMLINAHWWYGRFRFGPVEWVWRSITYGRFQVMRRWNRIAQALPALRPTRAL